MPGFQPFINAASLTNSTWFISTSIKQEISADTYTIEQDFSLDSRPFISASPEDLPYTGCAILLTGFPANRTSSNANNRTESCNGLLDEDCRSAITRNINSLIGRRTLQFTPDPCETIISSPPSQCKGFAWSGVKSTSKLTELSIYKMPIKRNRGIRRSPFFDKYECIMPFKRLQRNPESHFNCNRYGLHDSH